MTSLKRFLTIPFKAMFALLQELIDASVCMFTRKGNKHEPGRKQLLIIRIDAIGDFILFLDTFKEYKKLYPAEVWDITLIGNNIWADLAINLPYADRCWFVDRKKFHGNLFYRYRILKKVRDEGFDSVIQPTFSREYAFGDSLVRCSAAAIRIGSAGDLSNISLWQKRRSDKWYTSLISADKKLNVELEYNAGFLRDLGMKEFQASAPLYPISVLNKLPISPSLTINAPYFTISPDAGLVGRQWPYENFAEIAKSLYEFAAWIPVILAGPGNDLLAKKMISCFPMLPWRNLAGKLSLSQAMLLLSKSRMHIGNESGAVHLAASVGCPVVCIMGGGHFGRFFPYGNLKKNRVVYRKMDCFACNWQCKFSTVKCIEEISVDLVWQEICRSFEDKALP